MDNEDGPGIQYYFIVSKLIPDYTQTAIFSSSESKHEKMVEYHANWLPFRGSASLPSLLKILLALDNRKTEIFNNWDQLILVDKSEHLLYDHPIIFRVLDDETIVIFMMLSTVEVSVRQCSGI